ncbi:adhesin [Kitasatospora sp. NPDC089509]|uniref:adhesin n=1 Tax=Kitasatospora sp. NPDC089509 TaxID=3364079 RepID=UPI0037FF627F
MPATPESAAVPPEPEPLPDTAVTLRPPAGRPGAEGFAPTFARHSRPPVRHLLPGRRVWSTTLLAGSLAAVAVFTPGLVHRLTPAPAPVAAAAAAPDPTDAPATDAPPTDAPASDALASDAPPSDAPTSDAPASNAPAADGYTAWAGPGCPTPDGGGYREDNRDDTKGWSTVRTGGLTDHGCDGSFTAVPMSGDPDHDGAGRAVWWWSVGDAKSCDVSVYVPDDHDNNHVGGHPTSYAVLADPADPASQYGDFRVQQADTTGQTVPAGTFEVRGGRIAVLLLDRGDDKWADGSVPHHAAAQIQVTCKKG